MPSAAPTGAAAESSTCRSSRIVEHGVAVAERAALGILAGEPNRRALDQAATRTRALRPGPNRPRRRSAIAALRRSNWPRSLRLSVKPSGRSTSASVHCDQLARVRPAAATGAVERVAARHLASVDVRGASRPCTARRASCSRAVGLVGHRFARARRVSDALGDELVGEQLAHGRMALDALVHLRLRVRGLVLFVVAEAAVADQVDQHVAAELAAEIDREVHRARCTLRRRRR